MKKIFVIGGGTAGLISALILKSRFPNINVEIIESSKVGIVGVGESSTEHWKVFCESIGVPMEEFICNTNATFKNGVYFEDWGEEDFIHTVDTTKNMVSCCHSCTQDKGHTPWEDWYFSQEFFSLMRYSEIVNWMKPDPPTNLFLYRPRRNNAS